jgi:hypothetical protein
VLTRQVAERFGAPAVRRNLAAGRWVAVGRVVVLHDGPLPAEQLLRLTVLSGLPGSALGSSSALAFDGLRTAAALPPHLVIPDGARRPVLPGPVAGVVITRSVALGLDDVHPFRVPRRTRPADPDGGIRSLPEQDFATLVRRAGLPAPQRQALVRDGAGRYYLDADWPERGLSAEVHGIHHARMSQLERDWDRHNALTVRAGRRILHFTSHQVRTDPGGWQRSWPGPWSRSGITKKPI